MLEIYQRLGANPTAEMEDNVYTCVTLSHDQRERGRLKLVGDTGAGKGEEVHVFLERGKPLLVGEYLLSECGKYVKVVGQTEQVSHATCDDWEVFSKACYHLGNRHVKLQVGERWLRIQPDHVLEEMLKLLGLTVTRDEAVFVPESGAYSSSHSHSHTHSNHSHSHGSHSHDSHSHKHGHSHEH